MTLSFPQVALDTRIDLLVGGTWTTITPDVYTKDPISISRGRSDEGARTDATSCRLTLKNLDGKYSPRNPISPYYGLIGRNTPLRVSVPADATHLLVDGSGTSEISTPDSALLSITGDFDVRIEVALDFWQGDQNLCGKYRALANDRSWALRAATGGFLELRTSQDGATYAAAFSTVAVPTPATGRLALRATMDVNNGAAGNTVTFYTAPTIGGTWTQLGAPVVTAGVVTIFDSAAPVEVGDITDLNEPMTGSVYAFQLYSGIAGTIRANPNLTIQTPGATTFADTAGTPNTWTVSSTASISDRDYRAHVEVSSWPPKWGTSGKIVRVPIEAAGILRRLGQGAAPLRSPLYRGLVTLAAVKPVAYWPAEDEAGATVLASGLAGGSPMSISGSSDLASDSSFVASKPLPRINAATWTGSVASYTNTTNYHQTRFLLSIPAAGTTNGAVIARVLMTGTAARFDLVYSTAVGGAVGMNAYAPDGTLLVASVVSAAGDGYNGDLSRFGMSIQQIGADVQFGMESTSVGSGSGGGSLDIVVGRTCGLVRRVIVNPNGNMGASVYGHISVGTDGGTIVDLASEVAAYNGETAGRRIQRLCTEEGIAFKTVGNLADSAAMGPQTSSTLLNLLADAAAADMGVLFEPRSVLGLGYRTRASLYNQPVKLALDYATPGHVAPPLDPVDDDLATRNDITVSRTGGSSARAVLETGPLSIEDPQDGGAGLYATATTVNVATDTQLPDLAGWSLHLGTWDETRYPSVHVNLLRAAALIPSASRLDVGDRLTISNPPDWLPPDQIDLLGQGFTEVLKPFGWDIITNCSPGGPWLVGVVDDSVYGRADTDGSSLAAAVTNTATTFPVQSVADGPLWTTDPAEYPFDLRLGGETVTATACTSAVVDAFTRSTSSTWGNADVGGAWTLVGTASDYSTSGTTGRHSLGSVNVARATVVGGNVADFDVVTSVSTSALATGASHVLFLVARYTGSNDFMAARLEFTTAAAVNLTLRKRVAGVDTQLATITTGLTHVAGTLFRVRFQGAGTNFKAKAWLASGTEPTEWGVVATDASITAAGQVGVRSSLNTSNTNTLPITATFDNFALTNPQAITVTRSVNGVVKAQSAAEDIRLAHPMILSL